MTHFWYFGTTLYISGMVEGRNFKFGIDIARKKLYEKNAKLGQKGSRRCHVTHYAVLVAIVRVCCVSDRRKSKKLLIRNWCILIEICVTVEPKSMTFDLDL